MEHLALIGLAGAVVVLALFGDTLFHAIRLWASGAHADATFGGWNEAESKKKKGE